MTPEAVWAINPDQTVSRIDPRTNRVVARVDANAQLIAAGEGDVWIVEDGGIAEIDTARNVVSRRVELKAEFISALAVGAGSVWIADPFDGSLWRIARDAPSAQAPHPARDVGERGRVRLRRRVGDERDRRRGLPDRPADERGARRRADGVTARRRCRRRRGVGRRGEPAVARRRAPVPPSAARCSAPARTRPDSCSSPTCRSRVSRVPTRRRSWTASATSFGSEASRRAGTRSASSRATRRPLSPATPTSSAAARTRRRTRGTSAWSASSGRSTRPARTSRSP